MTREQLIQAIYDNSEEWSCHDCIHLMEEENPRDVCWKCAEKLLKEYENKIRADAIDEFETYAQKWADRQECIGRRVVKLVISELIDSANELKEKNNEANIDKL